MRPVFVRGLFALCFALAGCGGQGTVATALVSTIPHYVPAALTHASIPPAPSFAVPRVPDATLRKSRSATSSGQYPFFAGEAALSNGVYYLAFSDGGYFGYYSYLSDPRYFYHFDLGYEYIFPGTSQNDIYFYDFGSQHFWYTSTDLFPYIYDFSLQSYVYYFQGSSNPREFYNFGTNSYITM